MSIDAFQLINARDPEEMVMMFRESMLDTGKSFKDLSRHEKALMAETTGMSGEMLKSLMNFMDLGMTMDESRRAMEDQDPTKAQTNALKELKTAIKQINKVLNFSNPFEAIYKGLVTNAGNHGRLMDATMLLSKTYQDIYNAAYSLDPAVVNKLTRPIVFVLQRFNEILFGGQFTGALDKGLQVAGGFIKDVASDLTATNLDNRMLDFGHQINALEKASDDAKSGVTKETVSRLKEKAKNEMSSTLELVYIIDKNNVDLNKKLFDKDGNIKADITYNALLRQYEKLSQSKNPLEDTGISLEESINKLEKSFNQERGVAGIVESQKGLAGRSNRLTQGISDLFEQGKPIFNKMFDLGFNILGAVVKGAIMSIAALSSLISGGADKLSGLIDDETQKQLEKAGFGSGENGILKWLGLDKTQWENLANELAKGLTNLTASLPDATGIFYKLGKDLAGLALRAAKGISGAVFGALYSYIKDDVVAKQYLAATNPKLLEKLQVEASFDQSKSLDKNKTFTNILTGNKTFASYDNIDQQAYTGAYLKFLSLRPDLQNALNQGLPADYQSYLKDNKQGRGILDYNFGSFGINDANYKTGVLSSIAYGYEYMSSLPKEKELNTYLSKITDVREKNAIKKYFESLRDALKNKIADWAKQNAGVTNWADRQMYWQGAANNAKINYQSKGNMTIEKFVAHAGYPIKNVQDAQIQSFSGKNILIYVDGKFIKPHIEDIVEIVAAKPDGILFNSFNQDYNEAETNLSVVNHVIPKLKRNEDYSSASPEKIKSLLTLAFDVAKSAVERKIIITNEKTPSAIEAGN